MGMGSHFRIGMQAGTIHLLYVRFSLVRLQKKKHCTEICLHTTLVYYDKLLRSFMTLSLFYVWLVICLFLIFFPNRLNLCFGSLEFGLGRAFIFVGALNRWVIYRWDLKRVASHICSTPLKLDFGSLG